MRHSLSPLLHNAAFAECSLDWVYVAFDVAAGQAGDAVHAMRTLGLGGLSVTMPHKADVAQAVDRLSAVAQRLAAVNCVRWDGTQLVGENTDGAGFIRSLAEDADFDPAGRRCVVLGAGGAARAVVLALHDAGAGEVGVANRTRRRAEDTAQLAGPRGRVVDVGDGRALRDADLIVNATSVGMGDTNASTEQMPLEPSCIRRGHVVVDLVYHPLQTALLRAADSRGAATVSGVGMLLHQAGLAFEHWTGQAAPIAAMRRALLEQLGRAADGVGEHKP